MVKMLKQERKKDGVTILFNSIFRPVQKTRAKSFKICKQLLTGQTGFEIGGPSHIFTKNGLLPIYPICGCLDNCNFSQTTIWEGTIREGRNFHYHKKRPPGYQYIRDAIKLDGFDSNSYDFVLSSHTLEHIASPLQALYEWKRVLKEDGLMVLVLPHKDNTFDHLRPVTSLAHLIEDFEREIGEDDLTHLPEILELHDLEMDSEAGSFEEFQKRSIKNVENRCLHHHVFNTELVLTILNHIGLRICSAEPVLSHDIIAVGQKLPSGQVPDNRPFLSLQAEYRHCSPFPSDRKVSEVTQSR
ncbi:MAG: class I SAM-dependent methyltransferase [Deltaproteobacteria bacterium]|nr:class I SAM-dependent methyltransferase [Deltaproteobacteria bacterium]